LIREGFNDFAMHFMRRKLAEGCHLGFAGLMLIWSGFAGVGTAAEKVSMQLEQQEFGRLPEGKTAQVFILTNSRGMRAKVTDYGAILTELYCPDRQGKMQDVVLGFDNLAQYVQGHPCFGSTLGRVANRIAKARFVLDGKEYVLAANNAPNHIHGGRQGFHRVLWKAHPQPVTDREAAVEFTYLSRDGEEGYPGNLEVSVTYTLTSDNELRLDYRAKTDRPTPINLSNHSYFNLAASGDVLGHELMINADQYTPTDDALIPTGQLASVKGTPLDFTVPKRIGERIELLKPKPGGYDHNYVINGGGRSLVLAARAYEAGSGRVLEAFTTEPGVQLFTANFYDSKLKGVGGLAYPRHAGFCLETQHFPDSVNHANFPSVILRPGETFRSTTVFKFSTRT
jgi:aldose 1-epimerase